MFWAKEGGEAWPVARIRDVLSQGWGSLTSGPYLRYYLRCFEPRVGKPDPWPVPEIIWAKGGKTWPVVLPEMFWAEGREAWPVVLTWDVLSRGWGSPTRGPWCAGRRRTQPSRPRLKVLKLKRWIFPPKVPLLNILIFSKSIMTYFC